MKCVTSSFQSLFRVLKEPIATSGTIKKTEVKNIQAAKGEFIHYFSRESNIYWSTYPFMIHVRFQRQL